MQEIKYRGKVDGVWWYVSPDHVLSLFQSFWNLADRETIGQYTGLKDKSGKDIYEGDIVKTGGDLKPLPIIFEDGAFQIENLGYYLNKPLISQWMIEVIGNIYEHSDMLTTN